MSEKKPKRIGDVLVEKGVLSQDQLRIALLEQKRGGIPLGKALISLGFVTEATMRDALGEALQQESIDLNMLVPDPVALTMLPIEMAKRYNVVPVSYQEAEKKLLLAMSDTFNVVALDQIAALLGGGVEIESVLAGEAEIYNAIDRFYGFNLSIDGILHEIETGEIDPASIQAIGSEYSHPMIRLVDALIADAVKRQASDIHFEPEGGFLRVRYRIDGVLRQIRSLHARYWSAMVVRLKVMAGLNIAETRAPQDGRIQLSMYGRLIDFRVSSLPTLHGENIVLRILDRQKGIVPMERLGLTEEALSLLQLMMARPEGIILVTGPTGSGKTTTLYSILNARNSEQVNIMTLEDPVEFPIVGLRQSSVNEAARLTFATGIRAMMRQDPDIILVGEIRDQDTAEMAMRAAMTGHQVFATLHTNSAIGAIPRLLDIGLQPDILAGAIIGVVAQRLARRLCLKCRQPYQPADVERRIIGALPDEELTLYRAVGCPACEHQGYKGRIALMELLKMDNDLDECLARRATLKELQQTALSKGFIPLAEDGIRRIREGITTLDEISRVIDLTDRLPS